MADNACPTPQDKRTRTGCGVGFSAHGTAWTAARPGWRQAQMISPVAKDSGGGFAVVTFTSYESSRLAVVVSYARRSMSMDQIRTWRVGSNRRILSHSMMIAASEKLVPSVVFLGDLFVMTRLGNRSRSGWRSPVLDMGVGR